MGEHADTERVHVKGQCHGGSTFFFQLLPAPAVDAIVLLLPQF